PLTEVRDAKVLVEALDGLAGRFEGRVRAGAFARVRKGLEAARKAVRKRVLKEDDAAARVRAALEEARDRLKDLPRAGKGWPALGRRLYGDKPGAFTDRVKGYWKTWRSEPDDAPGGQGRVTAPGTST